uniref:transposase n=1 Tax=Prevotella amnii TaxID=419005 RepID=UPI0029350595|nr:transposase [Prevotella amnii]
MAYFTYMDFPKEVQRCIYTTNWIKRLNRKYKRTINMRTSMPSAQAVIFSWNHNGNGRNKKCLQKENIPV